MSARGLKPNHAESTPSASQTDARIAASITAGEVQSRRVSPVSSVPNLDPVDVAPISGKWLSVMTGADPVHVTDEAQSSQGEPSTQAVRDHELELLSPELMRLFKQT